MDIVDAQVHIGLEGFEPILAGMNALGIRAVLIDEFWGTSQPGDPRNFDPGYLLPNGAWRSTCPIGELASLQHPDRFSCVVRVDRRDPELECVLRLFESAPHVRGIRILPVWIEAEAEAFAHGAYDGLFDLVQELGLPVFVFVPGRVELLPPYLERFPGLKMIVDHCGMPFDPPRADDVGYFEQVLELARFGNVALKWSHAQARFSATEYPYEPIWPHLRRAIEAFGAERVIWASDHTVIRDQPWADLLYCIRDHPEIGPTEKEWILGRSLRKILDWPASDRLASDRSASDRLA